MPTTPETSPDSTTTPVAGGAGDPALTRMMESLLGDAAMLAGQAHDLLYPVAQSREGLRERLLDSGLIVPIPAATGDPVAVAAVDGALVKEMLYAADLLVVVAAAAQGTYSGGGHALPHRHWSHVGSHSPDNGLLASAAMAAAELALVNELSHDLRIIDGSHTSGLISLSKGLNAPRESVAELVADIVDDEVLQAVHTLAHPQQRAWPGTVVALPKSDSSTNFVDLFASMFGIRVPGGDQFLAAQVLEPGEMLYPRRATEHEDPRPAVPKDADGLVLERARQFAGEVKHVGQMAADGLLVVTYVKPESADTVVKAEMQLPEPLPELAAPDLLGAAMAEAGRVARVISDETCGPFMQEPFAQWAVDMVVKNVSVGSQALREAMLASLPVEAGSYLPYLTRAYRT